MKVLKTNPHARIIGFMTVTELPTGPDSGERLTYANSGVDIDAQDEAIRLLAPHARSTFNENVLTDVGLFGAAFGAAFGEMKEPVLVSSTDGVGTKLKYAYRFGTHSNAGYDLVSTCINDIICTGAKPLFFLDYIATHKVVPAVIEELVAGMADGCRESECSLIGGEIAEMRDTYTEGEYDLAGFAVGVVDRANLLPRKDIVEGDEIIGIPSSGIHCNGFSLVRKAFESLHHDEWLELDEELGRSPMQEVTRRSRIYWREAKVLYNVIGVKALAHISGGGLLDNVPRVLPEGFGAEIDISSLNIPPIFTKIERLGAVEQKEMFRTFNMGTGLAIIVSKDFSDMCIQEITNIGSRAAIIGRVTAGSGVVLV